MSSLSLTWAGGPLQGTVHLPASKSESNRALLLQKLAGGGTLTNLSEANDTVLMERLLGQAAHTDLLDAEDAGTVMRFMTAYLAVSNWRGTLTGAARMKQRPIAILVDALRTLGASIEYVEKEGYPPLRFGGQAITASADEPTELIVRGDISSQYISALLMIGPMVPKRLLLRLTGEVGSRPYIRMTLYLMRYFGARPFSWDSFEGSLNNIDLPPGGYQPTDYAVESDWSAASYWYAMVALAAPGAAPANAGLILPGLQTQSLQGDHVIQKIMKPLGVGTYYLPDGSGMRLRQVAPNPTELLAQPLDFTDCPDLAQTVAVVAAAKAVPLRMTGLKSLRIKETDRIAALQNELRKFGGDMVEVAPDIFEIQSTNFQVNGQEVATYEDHRMAMAFAPLALLGPLTIQEPGVVRKSYPSYWRELAKVGLGEAS